MKLNFKIISWSLIAILFITLIIKMLNLPAAFSQEFILIFSLAFSLIVLIIGGAILSGLTIFLLMKKSFWFFFRIWSTIILIVLHIYFYSPPLKIIIPNNFSGEVNLIVDPNEKQNLNINENGIGYIKKSILLKSRGDKKPRVYFNSGKKISADRIIGYDSIFFYGRSSIKDMRVLTFKILSE